ncbi:MAG: hypothetical protein PHF56_03645 [Desulfuromonadaceae bacterium]|nr:hypothetical protein [Desulfuromonadaceae bacterium]
MASFTKKILALIVVGMMMVGCGSDNNTTPVVDTPAIVDTPEVQSQKAMDEAYTHLTGLSKPTVSQEVRITQLALARAKTIDAYNLYPNQGSLLLRAFIEISANYIDDANVTLNSIDTLYASSPQDEFLRAYMSAQQNNDASVVLLNLQLSLNKNYSELPSVLWWGLVEKMPAFTNFRTTPQYQTLLAAKTVGKAVAVPAGYVCKENHTAYKTHWYGMEIDVSDKYINDITISLSTGAAIAPFFIFVDPITAGILVVYFIAEAFSLDLVNSDGGNCGVKLYNTWLTLPIFIPIAQK